MGREIRMVIPNWEHPQENKLDMRGQIERRYKPMFDETCEEAFATWQAEYDKWNSGEYEQIIKKFAEDGEDDFPKDQPYTAFCEWNGSPPDPEYYRPQWKAADMTWWQVYETVSEGTPVTPPFATQEELIEYLVVNGDFWDQRRRRDGATVMNCDPWSREQAEKFIKVGSAFSLVVDSDGVRSGVRALAN